MLLEKLMKRNVCTCSPGDTLNRAAQIMWEGDCGFLPVVDEEQRVIGVVTDRDLLMGAFTQGAALSASTVDTVMSRDVQRCGADASIGDVERMMAKHQIRRIPVTDTSGKLHGVVTLGDLARAAQSSAFEKAFGSLAISKTLATICEPRAPVGNAAE